MKRSAVVGVVLAALGARLWLSRRHDDLPKLLPTSSQSLPEHVQAFLQDFNLTEHVDAGLEALRADSDVRPGLHPDAPKQMRHPVVIVPGFSCCGLEVWKAHPCLGEAFFRRRIWTEVSMAEALLANWTCWLHHLQPDMRTGIDREGVRVRSAKGLRGGDYFIGNYWLWGKLIQNLADMGYTEDDMHMACYDWRIAYPLLEKRDRFLTRLRYDIEKLVAVSGEKAVVLGHSMGAKIALFFMKWVDSQVPGWCERHIASFVSLGGAILGAMSPLSAVMSGEMDATAAMGFLGSYIDTLALSYDEMREVYRSFGGMGGLLPQGGSAVWGSRQSGWTDAPVDIVSFPHELEGAPSTVEELYTILSKEDSDYPKSPSWTHFERGVLKPEAAGASDMRRLSNPLAAALPDAPSMKIWCLYGVGMPTERGYSYGLRGARWRFADREGLPVGLPEGRIFQWSGTKPMDEVIGEMRRQAAHEANANRTVKVDAGGRTLSFASLGEAASSLEALLRDTTDTARWVRINTSRHSDASEDPWDNGVPDALYANGVTKGDGDSTVPLTSLGYMCSHGWKDLHELNPSRMSTYAREFKHDPRFTLSDPRGGPATAKHVEIIGNHEVMRDVMHIVAGNTSALEQDRIYSNISNFGPIITERIRREWR